MASPDPVAKPHNNTSQLHSTAELECGIFQKLYWVAKRKTTLSKFKSHIYLFQ